MYAVYCAPLHSRSIVIIYVVVYARIHIAPGISIICADIILAVKVNTTMSSAKALFAIARRGFYPVGRESLIIYPSTSLHDPLFV